MSQNDPWAGIKLQPLMDELHDLTRIQPTLDEHGNDPTLTYAMWCDL